MGGLPTLVSLLALLQAAGGTAMCPEGCHCDTGGSVVCVGDGGTFRNPPSSLPAHTRVLKLRNFGLETLPTGGLLKKDLVRLDLSHNLLANLSREAFRELGGLQSLDLGDNRLARVDGAFQPLSSLENLSLRGNALSRLTAATFEGLFRLQHLNLDANQIASLDPAAFQTLPALAHLILSRNPLPSNLSRLDFFGSRLQFVDVSQVGLARIPACLTTHVRDLRLARNALTRVSAGDFESYPYLGLLVLDDNQIGEVERDALGRLDYLMRLWLNGNALRHVPAALPPSLRALYLEENLLESLPDHCFRGLLRLQQLFLQRNHIRTVSPCAFCDVPSLRNLDLQANRIENLTAGIFANLTHLESLDLSQNNLKWMDGLGFAGLDNLRVLQLSRITDPVRLEDSIFEPLRRLQTLEMYNSWSVASQALNSSRLLHGLRNVQELNVMHNRLRWIRPDLPSFFPFLKLIKLSENQWRCDSDILWMAKWMHYTSVQFYQSYRITCSQPPELLNRPVILLTERSFASTTTTDAASNASVATTGLTTEPRVDDGGGYETSAPATTLETTPNNGDAQPTSSIVSTAESTEPNTLLTTTLPDTTTYNTAQPDATTTNNPIQPNSAITTTVAPNPTQPDIATTTNPTQPNYAITTTTSTPTQPDITTTTNNPTQPNSVITTTSNPTQPDIITTITEPTTTTQPEIETTEAEYTTTSTTYITTTTTKATTSEPETTTPNEKEIQLTKTHSGSLHASALRAKDEPPFQQPRRQQPAWLAWGGMALAAVLTLTILAFASTYRDWRAKRRRRARHIAYSPHRDEISIVTVSEGTVGVRTSTHHGLGNRLYFDFYS